MAACETPDLCLGPFVLGEKQPPLEYVFLNSEGAAIDLTGYTAKFVHREKDQAIADAVTGDAIIAAPLEGLVTYAWAGTEYPAAGSYIGEFWAGNGTLRFASSRITWQVRSPVGPVPSV